MTDSDAALVFSGEAGIAAWWESSPAASSSDFTGPLSCSAKTLSTGTGTGSGRSIPQFHLLDALESMPDLFTKFGGHRQAAGLTLALRERWRSSGERLNRYALECLTVDDFVPTIEVDAVLDLTELNDASAAQILSLGAFWMWQSGAFVRRARC